MGESRHRGTAARINLMLSELCADVEQHGCSGITCQCDTHQGGKGGGGLRGQEFRSSRMFFQCDAQRRAT